MLVSARNFYLHDNGICYHAASHKPPICCRINTSSSNKHMLTQHTYESVGVVHGSYVFCVLMCLQDPQMQVSLMRTLDLWLAEDHTRVENRLCQREAVSQLVEVYSRLCRSAGSARSPVMPQMLDSLKLMLGRSASSGHKCCWQQYATRLRTSTQQWFDMISRASALALDLL